MRTKNNEGTIFKFFEMIQSIMTILDTFSSSLDANNTYKTDVVSIKDTSKIKLNVLSNIDNNINYEIKYQKYKQKYIKLKNNF